MNRKRKYEEYKNKKAALATYNKVKKPELTENSFYHDLEYSKGRKGYWDRNHTYIQLEDCIDIFYILFNKIKYLLEF